MEGKDEEEAFWLNGGIGKRVNECTAPIWQRHTEVQDYRNTEAYDFSNIEASEHAYRKESDYTKTKVHD